VFLVIFLLLFGHVTADAVSQQAGHHGIDPDMVASQFPGQRQGESHYRALGGGVMHRHLQHAHAGQ